MGSARGLTERIEQIFRNVDNFDESGFCNADLVTAELADDLGRIDMSEQKKLEKLGYEFSWFNLTAGDGMIRKVRKDGRGRSCILKLYFNQTYPMENERRKQEHEQRFLRTGDSQQPEEDYPGTEEDR